jgi:predicted RNA-binding Zn-ribbon protein involved in translation (DUF1610 family)
MSQQENLSLDEFHEKFSTDEACRGYLYAKRWPYGFVCPKCGVADEPYNISS